MKRKQTKMMVVLMVLMTAIAMPSFAQEKGKGRIKQKLEQKQAEIEAQRIVFYNAYLKLTTAEADKFWPLYKEFHQKQKELRKNAGKKIKPLKDKSAEELTKEESTELLKAQMELRQAQLDLEKEYIAKFQTAIPIQKVAKLKDAESAFKKELVKKAREKRKERMKEKQNPK